MTRIRKDCGPNFGFLAGFIAIAVALHPGGARGAGSEFHQIAMEELEVRGFREKPDSLYLPSPKRFFSYAPVRFDLFSEDLAKPVLTGEIVNDKNTERRPR